MNKFIFINSIRREITLEFKRINCDEEKKVISKTTRKKRKKQTLGNKDR